MIDTNKHKFFLVQILKDIYSDIELANALGFKGGTALMFFYQLPRFSVDLDFNLINADQEEAIYKKVRKVLLKYGTIHDEARKFYGVLLVLDYGNGERKLKVEISNRNFNDSYEIKNLLGINMKVMVKPNMFAHKLCALLDRTTLTNRDIFDCWFFMSTRTPLNKRIVEDRMGMPIEVYLDKCIMQLESINPKGLLAGLGELMDNKLKSFVRNKLHQETTLLLKFYQDFPIFE
ncbi:MAG: nucleotidyl transferase AbiEii/AbiGii toxin family protein [Draconibacterium sp.]